MNRFSLFGMGKPLVGKRLRTAASQALLAGDYAKALALFVRCHKEAPDDLRVYAKVAELREKTGDVAGAVSDYSDIAHAYAADGYVVQAIAINKLILRLDSKQTAVHESLKKLSGKRSSPSVDKLRTGLANTPLLSGMSGEQLVSFIDSLELRTIDAGECIYRFGESGDCLYIIGMGKVALLAADAHGDKKVFAHLKEGDFFGERAFMSRTAHVDEAVAESECTILLIERSTFDAWVKQHPDVRTTVEDFYRRRVLKRVLAISPMFEGVPADARMALLDKFTLRSFEDGDVVIREGDVGDTLYLIRSGTVLVKMPGSDAEQNLHVTLAEGEFFGEVAMLTGRPRTTTIHAKGSVELMELSRSDFEMISSQYPSVKAVVQAYLQLRAKETIDTLRLNPKKI